MSGVVLSAADGWGHVTYTRTFASCFDRDQVDELVGGAYKALAADLEERRPYIDRDAASAADHRLELLRHSWALLLDAVPS